MNERIKELAVQAGFQLGIVLENYTTPVKTITIEQRKFAELIIEECAKIAEECYIMHRSLSSVPDTLRNFERILE